VMVLIPDGFCMHICFLCAPTFRLFALKWDVFPFYFVHECCISILSCPLWF
jgi:hypothetical protein